MSKYPKWSEEEKIILVESYKSIPAYELSKRLLRPVGAIRLMARRLGLKADRTLHWTGTWRFLESNPYEVLSNTDRAYLAGVIDGEGWIVKSEKGFWRIGVANTEKPLIDWLKSKVEYSTLTFKKSRNPNWKDAWQWFLHSNLKIKALLELVSPYMVIRKKDAMIAISDIEGNNVNL